MKKKNLVLFLFIVMMLVIPVKANAFGMGDFVRSSFYTLVDGCRSSAILGDVNDPNSVAWLLQKVFDFIKVVGPILVVILSSVDFIHVIVKSDDDSMGKAGKRLGIRLMLAGLLFLIPTIVQAILDIFGFTSSTCGLN